MAWNNFAYCEKRKKKQDETKKDNAQILKLENLDWQNHTVDLIVQYQIDCILHAVLYR